MIVHLKWLAGMGLLALLVLSGLPLSTGPALESAAPPRLTPRPPAGPADGGQNQPDQAERNTSDDTPKSAIEGSVTDLSTGRPGAGLIVQIGQVQIKTDPDGRYSLTGLGAETLVVQLWLDPAQGVPAQAPVTVQLDGIHPQVVNLDFYSSPPPAPTPTLAPPQTLPETGGAVPGE